MCNLYDIGPAPAVERFGWEKLIREMLGDLTYVAPGKPGIVVRAGEPEAFQAAAMQWGFTRPWSKRPINNARDDKLEGKTWGEPFAERRCVIPARRFYEWSGATKPKTKHSIFPDPDHWFWIAGIWEENQNPEIGLSYTMLTTSANQQMQAIHHRMPVILQPDDIEAYLLAEDPPVDLVVPFEGELIFDPPL